MDSSQIELLVKAIFGLSLVILIYGVFTGNFFDVKNYIASMWAIALLIRMIFIKKKKPETAKKP